MTYANVFFNHSIRSLLADDDKIELPPESATSALDGNIVSLMVNFSANDGSWGEVSSFLTVNCLRAASASEKTLRRCVRVRSDISPTSSR